MVHRLALAAFGHPKTVNSTPLFVWNQKLRKELMKIRVVVGHKGMEYEELSARKLVLNLEK